MFSLTSNDKFPLKNTKHAIYCNNMSSINFGWGFFTIYENKGFPIHASIDFSVSSYDRLHYKNDKKSYL